jgi:hypothetical protein
MFSFGTKRTFFGPGSKQIFTQFVIFLGQLVPEAMVAYLDNHGPEKFATIFLGK